MFSDESNKLETYIYMYIDIYIDKEKKNISKVKTENMKFTKSVKEIRKKMKLKYDPIHFLLIPIFLYHLRFYLEKRQVGKGWRIH